MKPSKPIEETTGRKLRHETNLDEWVRAINEHGGFGIWQWAVSKDPADVTGIMENDAGRGHD
jgi:hypothetical protein